MNGTRIISRPVRWILVLLAASLCAGGCEKAAQNQGEDDTTQEVSQSELEALRSLPYAGGVETSEDEVGGVVFRDAQRSCPGYTLYGIHKLSAAELIDEDGKVVKSWSHAESQAWERAELLPNGDLLAIGSEPSYQSDGTRFPGIADDSRYVLRMNWVGELLWKRKICAHHDIELTPDGKLLCADVPAARGAVYPRDGAGARRRADAAEAGRHRHPVALDSARRGTQHAGHAVASPWGLRRMVGRRGWISSTPTHWNGCITATW